MSKLRAYMLNFRMPIAAWMKESTVQLIITIINQLRGKMSVRKNTFEHIRKYINTCIHRIEVKTNFAHECILLSWKSYLFFACRLLISIFIITWKSRVHNLNICHNVQRIVHIFLTNYVYVFHIFIVLLTIE